MLVVLVVVCSGDGVVVVTCGSGDVVGSVVTCRWCIVCVCVCVVVCGGGEVGCCSGVVVWCVVVVMWW